MGSIRKQSKIALLLLLCMFFSACGRKQQAEHYEVVDGKIVLVTGDEEDVIHTGYENGPAPGEASADAGVEITDGLAFSDEEYNSLQEGDALIDTLKARLLTACDACREIYLAADKGTAMNVTISRQDIFSMLTAIAAAGYPAQDSAGAFNMQGYEALDDFASKAAYGLDDVNGTYIIVYPDGHLSGFLLSRTTGRWHLYSSSAAWNDDGTTRIYSEGRYAVGSVRYTAKGWMIYNRDTSDFDENQRANTDAYVMIRVLPMDSEAKTLCQRYVEPVGYFENNLFLTDWNEQYFNPIDFNSLYAYIFAMYNGTEMLSSYNARSYYKTVAGTKLYLVPQDIFENNVGVYFRIDSSTLRAISDYTSQLRGYLFLGYDTDYYNVTPRTPFPEVVSYTYNANGTITMIVDAVNKWYGTDRSFRHELTVRPGNGTSFQYVSNRLMEADDSMLPAQKLAEMLNVERAKTPY
ncbi:MAG: hypothetical protein IJ237_05565 [Oscillospiraceae bacterium]|nr:hypothetical protein [Oscillospiraceae bacterium]